MTPNNSLSSTSYCLANPGSEYLAYQPGSGSFSVNLQAGTYNYEWFNPSSGSIAFTGTITASGGNLSFTPPFIGDAVLYLRAYEPLVIGQERSGLRWWEGSSLKLEAFFRPFLRLGIRSLFQGQP